MKVVFLLLSFFISTCISAQVTDLKAIDLDEDYTWRNSTLAERDHFYFKLPHIRHSNYKIHFRISLTGQTIDF